MKNYLKLFVFFAVVFIFFNNNFAEQSKVEKIINKHKIIFNNPPARIPAPHSVDAPLLGNGCTGVAISGKPEKQVYYFARNDFWRLKSSLNQSYPAVLGKLEIDIPGLKDASYLVEQRLFEAKTYSNFSKAGTDVKFKSYVSAVEDLLVVELSLAGKGELEGSVNLKLPGKQEFIDKPPFDLIFPTITEKGNTPDGKF